MRNEEQYPHLEGYLAIFDPERSEVYPPAGAEEGADGDEPAPDMRSVTLPRRGRSPLRPDDPGMPGPRGVKPAGKPLLRAALILLIAAAIVTVFIIIGLNAIPGLE